MSDASAFAAFSGLLFFFSNGEIIGLIPIDGLCFSFFFGFTEMDNRLWTKERRRKGRKGD